MTYSLNATQEGMLYHHLSATTSGSDIEQIICVLPEEIDQNALTRSWQCAVEQYEILRTTFDWSSEKPKHLNGDSWKVYIPVLDLEGMSADEQEAELQEYLQSDRQNGFDLRSLPLMRFKLFRFNGNDYRLVWSFHHSILDGRSFTNLLKTVLTHYDKGTAMPKVTPFRDYITWLETGKNKDAEGEFWKNKLNGFTAPTPLVVDKVSTNSEKRGHGNEDITLPADTLNRLIQLATDCDVTLNTVVQGAWALLLHRYSGEQDIVYGATRACRHFPIEDSKEMLGVFINTLPIRAEINPETPVSDYLKNLRKQYVLIRPFEHSSLAEVQSWSDLPSQTPLFESIIVFENYELTELLQAQGDTWKDREFELREQTGYPVTLYGYAGDTLKLKLSYDTNRLDSANAGRMLGHLLTLLEGFATNPSSETRLEDLPLITEAEQAQLLSEWNNTKTDYPTDACIHELFEIQASKKPDSVAMVCRDVELTYGELDQRANQLARHLKKAGVGPDVLVGLSVNRSVDMTVALLGILKAGGAYVPLDPSYPSERIALMLEDSGAPVLITEKGLLPQLPEHQSEVICLDDDWPAIAKESREPIPNEACPDNLAYVIYTSGSTGKPKGVMIEHRNVINFFTGMDEQIELEEDSVWLAVTSLSFDISVLEIFQTLARGIKTIIYPGAEFDVQPAVQPASHSNPIDFSFFYFASDQGEDPQNKYRLLLEGARYADENGFTAVWTPERHFHDFGGLYPNPSVVGAALAVSTKNVRIRSGSVVAPLHSPIRIAEEWSVVDNLSGGRAGLSFASGWMPDDFAIRPENYADRKEIMLDTIEKVRALWRGETVTFPGPLEKDVPVKTLPRPIQEELPIWVTTAGNPETYIMAAKAKANVLTHLLGQSIEEVAEKIKLYRKTWKEEGHPGRGHVSLMLHTFVSDDPAYVKEIVREPMREYLRSSASLIRNYSSAFPVFKRLGKSAEDVNFGDLNEEEMDALLDHAFDRYFETSGLFGTVDNGMAIVNRLKENDIDEVACLLDFGISPDVVLKNLPHLNQVREVTSSPRSPGSEIPPEELTIPALIRHHGVTHFQCTPSMAGMILVDPDAKESLADLKCWMIGGEAMPVSLAGEIRSFCQGKVINMYGPTETTIWSTTHTLSEDDKEMIPIGRPIANTEIYILDKKQRPVPIGVPGELLIGGDGVVRGYHQRPDLTADRFIDYSPPGSNQTKRIYRTGDLARYLPGGKIEFLGRMDHQVKIRGYRIELGEIEKRLAEHSEIRETVVIVREDNPGDKRLVAYFITQKNNGIDSKELRHHLKDRVPEFMVPSHFVRLDAFPQTPNRKVDRKQLPPPGLETEETSASFEPPATAIEEMVAELWRDALGVEKIGLGDNFFDLGGHSLSAVQLAASISKQFAIYVPLRTIMEEPNLGALSARIVDILLENAEESELEQALGDEQLELVEA